MKHRQRGLRLGETALEALGKSHRAASIGGEQALKRETGFQRNAGTAETASQKGVTGPGQVPFVAAAVTRRFGDAGG